jgi:hypothetical protein
MKMKMMFAVIAMLLSTASARTLKSTSCDEDYQAPNYWGECINGEFRNIDRYWNDYTKRNENAGCDFLVILVPQESVGDKTLTVEFDQNERGIMKNSTGNALQFNDFGYYSLIASIMNSYDPGVTVRFFLDGTKVHEGNYKMDECQIWGAGDVTTNDPKAVTYGGSRHFDQPGHVITSF